MRYLAVLILALLVASPATASLHYTDSVHVGVAPGLTSPRFPASVSKTCQPKHLYNLRQFKNLAGMVLWEYVQQVDYCTENGFVTYFYRYRVGRTPSITPVVNWTVWEFDGNVNTNCGNEHCFVRNGKARSRKAWTQGKFHACLVVDKIICNYLMPELSMTVYGTGGYEGWTKGG